MYHYETLSENSGRESLLKSFGRKIVFEVENDGRKNSETRLQMIHSNSITKDSTNIEPKNQTIHVNSIPSDLTNIEPKNKHNTYDSRMLQKLMTWDSSIPRANTASDLRASTISTTAQTSTFSTTTSLAHNNL